MFTLYKLQEITEKDKDISNYGKQLKNKKMLNNPFYFLKLY